MDNSWLSRGKVILEMKQSVVNNLSTQDKVCHDTVRTKESKESIKGGKLSKLKNV